jgi:hypothetical protein
MEAIVDTIRNWKDIFILFIRKPKVPKCWREMISLFVKEYRKINRRIDLIEKTQKKLDKHFWNAIRLDREDKKLLESLQKVLKNSDKCFSDYLPSIQEEKRVFKKIINQKDFLSGYLFSRLYLYDIYREDIKACLTGVYEKRPEDRDPFNQTQRKERNKRKLSFQRDIWIKYFSDSLSEDEVVRKAAKMPEGFWYKQ